MRRLTDATARITEDRCHHNRCGTPGSNASPRGNALGSNLFVGAMHLVEARKPSREDPNLWRLGWFQAWLLGWSGRWTKTVPGVAFATDRCSLYARKPAQFFVYVLKP